MKYYAIPLLLVMMGGFVNATELSYGDIFIECGNGASSIECASYFFVPNFHLKALKILVWDNVISIIPLYVDTLSHALSNLTLDLGIWGTITGLWDIAWAVVGVTPMLKWFIGVISGLLVYVILMSLEFVKVYLVVSTMWLCCNAALEKISKYDMGSLGIRNTSFIGVSVMILGTFYLLWLDWGNLIGNVLGG